MVSSVIGTGLMLFDFRFAEIPSLTPRGVLWIFFHMLFCGEGIAIEDWVREEDGNQVHPESQKLYAEYSIFATSFSTRVV